MKQNSIMSINDFKSFKELDHITSICYAIMKMETPLIDLLLSDEIDYEDIGKKKFVEKLNDRFVEYRTLGDSELLLDLDICHGCNCNQPVCVFIGNISGKHFGLFFEIINEEISDIYHCNWYGDDNFTELL